MKLFENGVGRPSNEVLRKRKIVTLSIAIGVIAFVAILIGGITLLVSKSNNVDNLKGSANTVVLASQKKNIFSIFGDLFKPKKTTTSPIKTTTRTTTKKVSGNKVSNINNSIELLSVTKDSILVEWRSKKGIKSIEIYAANSDYKIIGKSLAKTIFSGNKKSGSYRFGSGGKAVTIKENSYYIVKATFNEGIFKRATVLNLKVKTPSSAVTTKVNKASPTIGIKHKVDGSFEVNWLSHSDLHVTSISLFLSNSSEKLGKKLGTIVVDGKDGSIKFGGYGGYFPNEINPNLYYLVWANVSNGSTIKKLVKVLDHTSSNDKYRVVYFANNGTDQVNSQFMSYGTSEKLEKNIFKNGNKKFNGWIVQAHIDGKLHSLVSLKGDRYWKANIGKDQLNILNDGAMFSFSNKKVSTVYMIAKWFNDTDKFIVNDYGNCKSITAPKLTKYWRIATFYKEQSSGSFGSNKIENLNENHYADSEETRIICFDKQKYDNETYRLMVKKTTGANDKVSGSVSSWKPSGWSENNDIGWAYKDFNINW